MDQNKTLSQIFVLQRENGNGLGQFWLPWNDLPMPDLSELVMRWLGDWPDDIDQSISSKRRQKAHQNIKDSKANYEASQHLNQPQANAADNTKDNGPSVSRRKKRKKKKK